MQDMGEVLEHAAILCLRGDVEGNR